jgi:beta-lactamase class A
MCSTFKASLAACVLASIDRGQARLDELIAYGPDDLLEYALVAKQNLEKGAMSVADMCEAAVELSDNTHQSLKCHGAASLPLWTLRPGRGFDYDYSRR